jgi:hypothetical protein
VLSKLIPPLLQIDFIEELIYMKILHHYVELHFHLSADLLGEKRKKKNCKLRNSKL